MVAANPFLLTAIIALTLGVLKYGESVCPGSNEKTGMKRVGNTRYFIYHVFDYKKETAMFRNWTMAKALCSQTGFKMATIENETTFAVVGRALERIVTDEKLRDTWYWLDATYNDAKQAYFWSGDIRRPVKFSNFFYRYPRPTGVGSHFSSPFGSPDKYEINSNETQCLTIALPLPANTGKGKNAITFGHSTTFDERPCRGRAKRHAICESTLPECNPPNDDPFSLTEDKKDYFEDGNWIIGERRYIVNWKQRTINESRQYCDSLGLTLYDPTMDAEFCIIPQLKMWSRNMTVSQFWTGWTYTIDKPGRGERGIFLNSVGAEMKKMRFFGNITDQVLGRSNKFNNTLCVAMQHSYEFRRTQFPCSKSDDDSGCHWNFIQLVPANCNNYHATICQQPGSDKVLCVWDKAWADMPLKYVNNAKMATVEFGYAGNKEARRSKFKQTFGNLACPEGYRMARANRTKELFTIPAGATPVYKYDTTESYWVIDNDGFSKDENSKCTIISNQKEVKVPCFEWHFYLCEKLKVRVKPYEYELVQKPNDPVVKWNETRHERTYPIRDAITISAR